MGKTYTPDFVGQILVYKIACDVVRFLGNIYTGAGAKNKPEQRKNLRPPAPPHEQPAGSDNVRKIHNSRKIAAAQTTRATTLGRRRNAHKTQD